MKTNLLILNALLLIGSMLQSISLNELPQEIFVEPMQPRCEGRNRVNLSNSSLTNITNISNFQVQYNGELIPLRKVPNLELDLNGNSLTELPAEIGELKNLVSLNLNENLLTNLPEEIGNLSILVRLSANFNTIARMPSTIGNLTNLVELDLMCNVIEKLPLELGNLFKLTKFNVEDNFLTSIETIDKIISLKDLNLSRNPLTSLSVTIGSLTNITDLAIAGTKLKELPTEIGKLHSLTTLNISGNYLNESPYILGRLPHLTDLVCDASVRDSIYLQRESSPFFLSLESVNTQAINTHSFYTKSMCKWTPEMAPLTNMSIDGISYNYLNLENKRLISIEGISQLLVYDWTEVDENKRIKKITDIESLIIGLSHNKLKQLSEELTLLPKLIGIDVSHNRKLKDMAILSGLLITYLNASYNELEDIEALQGMPLERLDLSNNQIKDITPLQGMSLVHLNLANNIIDNVISLSGMPLMYADLSYNGVPFKCDNSVYNFSLHNMEVFADMPLVNFNLMSNSGGSHVEIDVEKIFDILLKIMNTLENLYLAHIVFTPEQIQRLADILVNATSLTKVGLPSYIWDFSVIIEGKSIPMHKLIHGVIKRNNSLRFNA